MSHFNGPDYNAQLDDGRLSAQHERVKALMLDGVWRTLGEIAAVTGDPEASISAQLRHLRKRRFGAYVVLLQARGEREHGLWEYQVLPPTDASMRAAEVADIADTAARALSVKELEASLFMLEAIYPIVCIEHHAHKVILERLFYYLEARFERRTQVKAA
jgi:hypothetical protein